MVRFQRSRKEVGILKTIWSKTKAFAQKIRSQIDSILEGLPNGTVVYALNLYAMFILATLIYLNWTPGMFQPVERTFFVTEPSGLVLELKENSQITGPIARDVNMSGLSLYELAEPESYMNASEYDGKIFVCHPSIQMTEMQREELVFQNHGFLLDSVYGYAGLEEFMTIVNVEETFGYLKQDENANILFSVFFRCTDTQTEQYVYCNQYNVWKENGASFVGINADTTVGEMISKFGYPYSVDVYQMEGYPTYALICFLYNNEGTAQQITIGLVEDENTENGYFVTEITSAVATLQE